MTAAVLVHYSAMAAASDAGIVGGSSLLRRMSTSSSILSPAAAVAVVEERPVPYYDDDHVSLTETGSIDLSTDGDANSSSPVVEHDTTTTAIVTPSCSCDACQYCDDRCDDDACRSCMEKDGVSLSSRRCGPLVVCPPCPAASAVSRRSVRALQDPSSTGENCYTRCQVRRHNREDSCWIVAGDIVYDVTPILKTHPGGARCLLRKSGGCQDCTTDLKFHSPSGRAKWDLYKIGTLVECRSTTGQTKTPTPSSKKPWWSIFA